MGSGAVAAAIGAAETLEDPGSAAPHACTVTPDAHAEPFDSKDAMVEREHEAPPIGETSADNLYKLQLLAATYEVLGMCPIQTRTERLLLG